MRLIRPCRTTVPETGNAKSPCFHSRKQGLYLSGFGILLQLGSSAKRSDALSCLSNECGDVLGIFSIAQGTQCEDHASIRVAGITGDQQK